MASPTANRTRVRNPPNSQRSEKRKREGRFTRMRRSQQKCHALQSGTMAPNCSPSLWGKESRRDSAATRPSCQAAHHFRAARNFWGEDDSPVTPLEDMATLLAEAIESDRKRRLQPTHPLHQVWPRRRETQVIVVGPHAPRMHDPAGFLAGLAKTLQERRLRPLLRKDIPAIITTTDHVINRAPILHSQFPGHGSSWAPARQSRECKVQSLTPLFPLFIPALFPWPNRIAAQLPAGGAAQFMARLDVIQEFWSHWRW